MRAIAFFRSLLIVACVAVGSPIALAAVSRWRFGSASPLHGVPGPDRWSAGGARSLLAAPLTERTLGDVAIRLAVLVAWVAVLVFVLTVVVEAVHMIRHGGHHLPDVRGLRWSQRAARVIAAGIVALLPALSQATTVIALVDAGSASLVPSSPVVRIAPALGVPALSGLEPAPSPPAAAAAHAGEYVVRAGDSVFGIARQHAGPDDGAVAVYAERMLDLNLGREMVGGQRFTNPGLIDIGWVLQLPPADSEPSVAAMSASGTRHEVLRGESLWSIADDELGNPTLWPEVFDANAGRIFADGRTLVEPALLQPGWDLIVPAPGLERVDEDVPAVITEAAPPSAVVEHDAHHGDASPAAQSELVPAVAADATGDVTADVVDVAPASPAAHAGVAPPENVWVIDRGSASSNTDAASRPSDDADSAPQLLTIRRAVMLIAGVLTLVAVRRRRRLREAPPTARLPEPGPHVVSIERELRRLGAGERVARVDLATRAATLPLLESGQRLMAVLASADGTIEIVASGPAALPAMWRGAGERWTLPGVVPLETIADDARRVNAPCPALVQLGVDDDGRDVYVDLEALGALEVGGPQSQRDAIVAAIAATLAGSVLAEVTTLISVAVPVDAFLGHRLHVAVADAEQAFELARQAVGTMPAMHDAAFVELRARGTAGESWDPAVVLLGSAAGTQRPPRDQPGLAVVSAAPIEGPSSTLVPDADGWLLRPLAIRLQPIGLVPHDLSAISALVNVAPLAVSATRHDSCAEPDGDCTVYAIDEHDQGSLTADEEAPAEASEPGWDLMVRLFGPVEVVDRDGNTVSFERSKSKELVAWLATHRDRSTRANARAALWEQDVRDATFANVVSEARRALARRVPPPHDEEWVGRTLTEELPLHPRVTTDADLLARALAGSREQSPESAIGLLRDPVEAVAGLPFEDTSYVWPDGEGITSNLILLATSAAAELAARCLAVGDIEGVFAATARGLRVLPGHEELIGLRMRAHARAGDHAAVRHEWSSYERVVNGDPWSDGEPSPKLVDLRKELLHPGV